MHVLHHDAPALKITLSADPGELVRVLDLADIVGVKKASFFTNNSNKQSTCTHFVLSLEFANSNQMDNFCFQLSALKLTGANYEHHNVH